MEQIAVHSNYAHSADVLGFLAKAQTDEPCALVVVIATEGGGTRAPGALMAVTRSGKTAGYVSNGCVDAAVVLNAQDAISRNEATQVRYGKDSPFLDIKLPCGGSLDLLIIPTPNPKTISEAAKKLIERHPTTLRFSADGTVVLAENISGKTEWRGEDFIGHYVPKLKLRVIGRGIEPLALAKLGLASDMEVILQSPDEALVASAAGIGAKADLIQVGQSLNAGDDPWTACILMFHDHDWEYDILAEALKSDALYIGAMGSQKTHEIRSAILRERGVSELDIQRIKAPIGLIPRTRDASMLAISTLADVAAAFQKATI